jgi:UDP-glucose 4-epimerase
VRGAEERRVNAFENRAVLVIGGFGFIGTNLTDRLAQLGARVTIATSSLDRHRGAAAERSAQGVRAIEADLRDLDAMRTAVMAQEVVFNLAGQSGAVRSMEDPWTDLDVNCRGNLALLEALRAENRAAKLVFVSSRLAYGEVGRAPVGEDHLPEPLCIHAVHKLAVEQYLKLYGRIYGLQWTAARLTNPYGPGQPRDRVAYGVVNRMIHQAIAGETLVVYGDGLQRRDYVHIDDAVDALLRMAESTASAGRTYNVGSGVGTPFIDMAHAISSIAGSGRIERVPWPPMAEKVETGDFVADLARIREELGWQPAVSLADGLERTISYYKAFST